MKKRDFSRNIFQCHNVHGGQQRGDHHHGAQLPPQDGGDPRDAGLGQDDLPPVGSLDNEDVTSGGDNHEEDNPGPEEDEGVGQEGD